MKDIKSKLHKVLRYSEKYTGTDMVYLARGSFWITLGQIISSLAAFGLAIAYANFFSQGTYGTYKYVLSIVSILAIASLPGMSTAVVRAVAKGYDKTFFEAVKTRLRWSTLGSLIGFIIGGYYYFNNNLTLAGAFLIVSLLLPFTESFTTYNAYLSGKHLFKRGALYSASIQVITASFIALTLFLSGNLFLVLTTYFSSYTILRFYFYRKVRKEINTDTESDSASINYGKHLGLMNVIGAVAGQLDSILLWKLLGAAPLAIYSFALAPLIPLRTLFKSIFNLALPKLSVNNSENIKKTLPSKMFKATFLTAIIVAIFIFILPTVYRIFLPQYLESVKFAQVLLLTLVLSPGKLMGVSITSKAKKRTLYTMNVLNSIAKIILILVFLPLFGIWGAVIAMLTQYLFSFVVSVFFFRKL